MVATKLAADDWLSKILGHSVYLLHIERPEEYRGELEIDWPSDERWFIYTKAPANALGLVCKLEDVGFRLVEANMQFEKSFDPNTKMLGEARVRLARDEDEAAVRSVSENSFVYSRFHLDPAISKTLADKIKSEWATNYFTGRRGDAMIVAEVQGQISGFLQLFFAADVLVIDLIAVDAARRQMGVAYDMIAFAQANFEQFKLFRVGTQVSNVSSIRLYEKLGFRAVKSQYVLHRHFCSDGF